MKILILLFSVFVISCSSPERKNFRKTSSDNSSIETKLKKVTLVFKNVLRQYLNCNYRVEYNLNGEEELQDGSKIPVVYINVYYQQDDVNNLDGPVGVRKRNLSDLGQEIYIGKNTLSNQSKEITPLIINYKLFDFGNDHGCHSQKKKD